jgi:hypothetical protein
MAALEHLLDATRAGYGRSLVVEGEAGIGKTALLRFASDHASGFQLLRAEGAEFEMELARRTSSAFRCSGGWSTCPVRIVMR